MDVLGEPVQRGMEEAQHMGVVPVHVHTNVDHVQGVPQLVAHRFNRPRPSICPGVAVGGEDAEQEARIQLARAGVAHVASPPP